MPERSPGQVTAAVRFDLLAEEVRADGALLLAQRVALTIATA